MSSLTQSLNELKFMIEQVETDVKKLEGGKKASSSQIRKILMNIKTKSHGMRKSVSDHVKTIPIKTRVKKDVEHETEPEPTQKKDVEHEIEPTQKILQSLEVIENNLVLKTKRKPKLIKQKVIKQKNLSVEE